MPTLKPSRLHFERGIDGPGGVIDAVCSGFAKVRIGAFHSQVFINR